MVAQRQSGGGSGGAGFEHRGDQLLNIEEARDLIYGRDPVDSKNVYKLSSRGVKIRGTDRTVRLKPTFRPNGIRWWRSDVEAFLAALGQRGSEGGSQGGLRLEGGGDVTHQRGLRDEQSHALKPRADARHETRVARRVRREGKKGRPGGVQRCRDEEIGTYPALRYPRDWEFEHDGDPADGVHREPETSLDGSTDAVTPHAPPQVVVRDDQGLGAGAPRS